MVQMKTSHIKLNTLKSLKIFHIKLVSSNATRKFVVDI